MLYNLEIIGEENSEDSSAKLDEGVGRVQFGSEMNFANSIISKLNSMLSYYVLIILYTRIKYG